MIEEVVEIIMTVAQESVEITIKIGIRTTAAMRVTMIQVTDYATEKHFMKDTEFLTVFYQTQK